MSRRNSPRTRLVVGAFLLAIGGSFTLLSCSKSSSSSEKASHHAAKKPGSKKDKIPAATKNAEGAWVVAASGSRFDPPVKIEAVPENSWYCDMGTVHYAQSEAGDKTCKLCKMKLMHKSSGAAPAPKH